MSYLEKNFDWTKIILRSSIWVLIFLVAEDMNLERLGGKHKFYLWAIPSLIPGKYNLIPDMGLSCCTRVEHTHDNEENLKTRPEKLDTLECCQGQSRSKNLTIGINIDPDLPMAICIPVILSNLGLGSDPSTVNETKKWYQYFTGRG